MFLSRILKEIGVETKNHQNKTEHDETNMLQFFLGTHSY